ncbi:MAG: universal stress protein [Gammaproteobacteria bacterium]|nr:MAG: universal stress protein [Gammaproteobacteria bacterium]
MSYQHILLVTDLKQDADLVAQKAKQQLTTQSSQLSILHIVQDTVVGFGYELIPASSLNEIDEEHKQQMKAEMVAFLDRNQLNTQNTNISAEVVTAISSTEGIISYCDAHQVDLLVIGRHERHGLSALLHGSTVDNIIPNIKCDVLVVHLDI